MIVSNLYTYLNKGDKVCECYSCLKMIVQADLHVGFFTIFFIKAYFRRRAEARRAEIISARLGSAWHASVLDEENITVLKQLY